MNKKEIFKKLDELDLDKDKYLIIGGAALVCQGIKKETSDIDLSCNEEYYNNINWDTKIGNFNKEKYVLINDYRFMTLEDLLELKRLENRKEDKSIIKKLELEIDLLDTYKNERELRKEEYKLIGGVDEVGRGPLVGPVVAACCILPEEFDLDGLTDSKKLSEKKRDYFYEEIKRQAISYGIGIVSEKRIDEINIYEATKEAMTIAINNCNIKPDYVLTDAMKLDLDIPVKPIIKGDLRSITISAASVLAKVTRDRMMYELDKKYPMYDFKNINDIFYVLMWMEELYPNFGFRMDLPNNNKFNNALLEWNNMKVMRNNKSISYEQYLDWKLSYEFDDCR